jgi:hypothetical protein
MSTRPVGSCQVQPEWRKKILEALPRDGGWGGVNAEKLIGSYVEDVDEDEDMIVEDGDLLDYDDWYDDRMEWIAIALKEAEFLGHIERRRAEKGGGIEIRLTEAGAIYLRELIHPKAKQEAA